jgi:hypothetical protein
MIYYTLDIQNVLCDNYIKDYPIFDDILNSFVSFEVDFK